MPMDVFSKLNQLQWGCSTMEFHNFQDPSNIHGDAISPSTEICNKRSGEPEWGREPTSVASGKWEFYNFRV
jgi:hypothetical protein